MMKSTALGSPPGANKTADWQWETDDYLIKDIRDLVADSAPFNGPPASPTINSNLLAV